MEFFAKADANWLPNARQRTEKWYQLEGRKNSWKRHLKEDALDARLFKQ